MPLEILVLQVVVSRDLEMASGAVVRVVLMSILLPLAAGMAVRSFMPKVVGWLEKPLALVTKVLLPLWLLVLLVIAGPAIWELIGNGTLIAIIVFIIVGFGVGHVLGGPDPDHSVVLAMSTACRHPAVALSHRGREFPGGALRRHHPALSGTRRNRRHTLCRLAATADSRPGRRELLMNHVRW